MGNCTLFLKMCKINRIFLVYNQIALYICTTTNSISNTMKAHPSIAFNALSGTAGEVTARETKNGTVLSSRAQHSKVYTPAQKTERAILARIGRRFKTLTPEQCAAWNSFAQPFMAHTSRNLGSASGGAGAYRLTGFNVYVRHNCNRALLGLDPIDNPPAEIISVPDVSFEQLTITPQLIQFDGILDPGPSYRLAVAMSKATSAGVSYGRGKSVLIDPDFIPDEGVANLTRIYTERLGLIPEVGQKYFISVYWIERNTGFTGQRSYLDRICIEPHPDEPQQE